MSIIVHGLKINTPDNISSQIAEANSIQTIDDSLTDLFFINIDNNESVYLNFSLYANSSAGCQSVEYTSVLIKADGGGNITYQLGTILSNVFGLSGTNLTFNLDTNSFTAQINGLPATTIDWVVSTRILKL